MIGNCSAEIGGAFVSTSTTKDELFSQFGELESEAKAAYDPGNNKEIAEIQTKFNTDWVWGEPARFTARAFLSIGEPAYVYHFGYVPVTMRERARYGAGHGSEVAFVFGDLSSRWGATGATPEEEKLTQKMNTYWTNFAKTGNPNGEGLPVWPLYNTQEEKILDIELDGKVVGKSDYRKPRLDVIEKAFKNRTQMQTRSGI
jgi:para-nitrobenzyl esterase